MKNKTCKDYCKTNGSNRREETPVMLELQRHKPKPHVRTRNHQRSNNKPSKPMWLARQLHKLC